MVDMVSSVSVLLVSVHSIFYRGCYRVCSMHGTMMRGGVEKNTS